jgi:hypothetical protein
VRRREAVEAFGKQSVGGIHQLLHGDPLSRRGG